MKNYTPDFDFFIVLVISIIMITLMIIMLHDYNIDAQNISKNTSCNVIKNIIDNDKDKILKNQFYDVFVKEYTQRPCDENPTKENKK